jgi:hypothetical protein
MSLNLRLPVLCLLARLVPALLAASPAQGQPRWQPTRPVAQQSPQGLEHARAFLDRMVRVTARGPDGTALSGYGIIVGDGATEQGAPALVIVTADHLLRGPAGQDPPRAATITPFGNLGASPDTIVSAKHLPPGQGDLAVVLIPRASTARFRPVPAAGTLALLAGTPAWQSGRQGQWQPADSPGRFALRDPTGWLTFDGLDSSPAAAGSAVLTDAGLAGMLVGPDGGASRVLAVEQIAARLREWGFRWDLPSGTDAATAGKQPEAAKFRLQPVQLVPLLPSEAASRASWVPPGARLSPWADTQIPLFSAPHKDTTRIGTLPPGTQLPVPLWASGAYEIQRKFDDGAWFLVGAAGTDGLLQPLGYAPGADVIEIWPPAPPAQVEAGRLVREWAAGARRARLRDAGTHYSLTVPVACTRDFCDGIAVYTLRAPDPGAITPAFQMLPIAGAWQRGQVAEITVMLPRRIVETDGTTLMACMGLAGSCDPQKLLPGG